MLIISSAVETQIGKRPNKLWKADTEMMRNGNEKSIFNK